MPEKFKSKVPDPEIEASIVTSFPVRVKIRPAGTVTAAFTSMSSLARTSTLALLRALLRVIFPNVPATPLSLNRVDVSRAAGGTAFPVTPPVTPAPATMVNVTGSNRTVPIFP